jgi:hypothetical protein
LRGILCIRCREPEKALAHLHQARQKAIEQHNLAEAIEAGRVELEARRFADAERLFRLVASKAAATLPPREVLRVRINLCQALNRLERHQEALELTAALASDLATRPLEKRLAFLVLLEEARAQAGLKNFEAAATSVERARALLPADPNEFEHNEAREVAAELKLAKQDWTAIDDLNALAKKYTAPNLTVRAANLRMMAARVLFKTGQPTEAGRLLADALASAVKAGLPDLAQRIRSEMLEGEGAKHLDAVLKDTRALDAIGGEWSIDRQLIRVESLGEGGGGKVYRAIDLRDGKEVAVKEVSLATHSKEQRERIIASVRNEYAVAVTLPENVGIANVRGLLSDPDGTLFIVQDLIKGSSLAKLYKPEPAPARILPLLSQVADVLATLHANGVVHRDLKPDNVMVRRGRQGEEAVLIDFGIALLDADNDALKHYGTAGYIAPEQAQGEKVDGRADIYSLGRMLAEIWVGDGRNGAVPKPLAAIVEQMLQANPAKRPALDIVKAALDACCDTLKA